MTRHLTLFSVGDESKWVGHDQNMLYEPYTERDFGADDKAYAIVARTAYTTERPIVGRKMIIPDGRIGQVAILSCFANNDDILTAAITIPFKNGWFGRTSQVVSYVSIPSIESDPTALNQPSAFLHTTVRNALFELINTEPAQLTQTGE